MKKTKIILLISDVHGDVKKMKKILNDIKHDYSVLAGDFCCDDSIINKNITFAVRGNNDFYSTYNDFLDFEIEGIKFHLEHGHLTGNYFQLDNYDYMHKKLIKSNVDVFIHGHTHIPKIFEYNEGIIINPGSISQPRGGSSPSCAIIKINEDKNVQCEIINLEKI